MTYRLAAPFTVVFLATALLSLGITAVAFRHRSRRGAAPLAGFMFAVSIWCFGDAMRLAAPNEAHILFWNKVAYLGIVSTLPTFVTFVLTMTNREHLLKKRYILGMIGLSLAAYALVLSNPYHGLWRAGETVMPGTAPPVLDEGRGLLWYAWAAYSYTLVPVALYFLFREFLHRRQSRVYRNQIGLVLIGSLVASLATALFVFGYVPFDPSPLGFAVMGIAYTGALFRYRLLDITPIARDVVVDNMDSGFLVLNQHDIVIDANQRAREILDVEQLTSQPATSALPSDQSAAEQSETLREGRRVISVDVDGETRHFEVETSAITDSLGSPLGRVVVFTEVTELARKETRLQGKTQRLQRQNERLDEFAALVSHDLRNPLQVAATSLELAHSQDDEALDRAKQSLNRMESIIDDLLVLARAGSDLDTVEEVDLYAVGVRARDHVPHDGSQIRIREELSPVEGDSNRLLHLVENLFRNAIEHNDDPVTVTLGPLDAGFYVEDDGVGISPEDRDTVFEHGHTTTDDGTGFGLSIVEDIVEAHGWTIDLTESESGGARFEIRTT